MLDVCCIGQHIVQAPLLFMVAAWQIDSRDSFVENYLL